ncbi:hypothetical protein OB955_18420 [Halobacteria archaeon AArc-m2/3/4]|uniref:DUF7847 domain-containing protein n=1 Tax=Natronoglomus mannanivorans TaxID=2979990 RepID=A0AAP3E2V2_9EURY|nr:hypothetical protein [Halobacteria archaeon AArc-xg1-1]MCU4974697.1 hypothetical protein [Halobacteria archaeon AArc-m2/3/4]
MSLTISGAFGDALERLRDRRLLLPFCALYGVFVAITVGTHSQLEAQSVEIIEEFPELADFMPETFPLALDVSLGVAWLVWFLGTVSLVTASMLAFRVLADGVRPGILETESKGDSSSTSANENARGVNDSPDATPTPTPEPTHDSTDTETGARTQTHSLLAATAHGILAAIIGLFAVGFGLVLLVVPGLVVATLFAFTHPYIATDRVNAVEAMKRSLELTRGNRLRVFGLLVVTVCSFYAVSVFGALALELLRSAPVVGELVNAAFTALAWLVVLAILASAFDQLETTRAREDEKWEGIDDELLP